jgi:hypothetical protein
MVVWQQNASIISFRQWNGTSWEELGHSDSQVGWHIGLGVGAYPSIAVNSSGYPIITYVGAGSNSDEIYIKQYVPQ